MKKNLKTPTKIKAKKKRGFRARKATAGGERLREGKGLLYEEISPFSYRGISIYF